MAGFSNLPIMNPLRAFFYLILISLVSACGSSKTFPVDYLNSKYTNEQSEFREVLEANIHYRDQGSGETIVLLHGIGSSLHTWEGWTEDLKDQFRVVSLDLPGFGLTGADSSHNYTMQRYIEVLHEFLGSLDIDRYSLVGNSMGGWLAWEYALVYPDELQKLILIAPAGFITPDNPPKPLRLAQRFEKMTLKGPPKCVVRKFLKQAYGDRKKVDNQLVDRYFEINNRPGNGEAFYAVATGKYQPSTNKLPEIKIPTLIMWGSEDKKWIDVSNAQLFTNLLPNDQLIIYDGLGHLPMEENPSATANDAAKFLE